MHVGSRARVSNGTHPVEDHGPTVSTASSTVERVAVPPGINAQLLRLQHWHHACRSPSSTLREQEGELMKGWMSQRTAVVVVLGSLLFGCAGPGGQSGFETFARGVAGLMLSPLMIVAGLAQGIAF